MNQRLLVGSIVPIQRTGRASEHVLYGHGHTCAGVLLQFRERYQHIRLLKTLVQVKGRIYESTPGNLETAIGRPLPTVAYILEDYLVPAG